MSQCLKFPKPSNIRSHKLSSFRCPLRLKFPKSIRHPFLCYLKQSPKPSDIRSRPNSPNHPTSVHKPSSFCFRCPSALNSQTIRHPFTSYLPFAFDMSCAPLNFKPSDIRSHKLSSLLSDVLCALNSPTIRHPFTLSYLLLLDVPALNSPKPSDIRSHKLLPCFQRPVRLKFPKLSDIRSHSSYLPLLFDVLCALNSQTIRHPFTQAIFLCFRCPVRLKFPNHPTSVHTSYLPFCFRCPSALNSPNHPDIRSHKLSSF
ncbi:unnamed protein product [Acanthosepion pharaonis]|uniref:Uncharacterized protein n=1 Tax=Acanthosepion pharaonis TaxID=158019 RepID=A0A812EC80_ACAPH|nr:unnamed protein product [Sepia pharaonis]